MKNKFSLVVLFSSLLLVGCGNNTSSINPVSSNTSAETSVPASSMTASSETVSSDTPASNSESTSSSVAPTPSENVTLSADKTVLGLNDSALITINGNKGDISLVAADETLVDASIIKNSDGTYTVAKDSEAHYGGIMILNAVSKIDSKVKASIQL